MRKEIKLLLLAEMIFVFGSGLYGPIYAIFVQKIGGDLLDVGAAYAFFLIAMATLEYPVGKLMDKYGKKTFLAAAYIIATLVIFGYIFIDSVIDLFVLQILMGVAFAIGDPAWDAWSSEIVPKKDSGFDWAMYHMVSGYSAGISALIGGAVAQYLGFSALFAIGGIIAIFSFFTVVSIKWNEKKTHGKRKVFHRRHMAKRRWNLKTL